jgi:hypothetical protein
VGALFVVLSLGGLTFQVARAVSEDREQPRSGNATYTGDQFYADVREALNTLFEPAKALTRLTSELSSGRDADPTVVDSARSWEQDIANARDRVAQLAAPAQTGGSEARSAYEMGAALYVESAQQAARVVGTTGDDRREAVKTLARLEALGDRVFDVGTRVLRSLGPAVDHGAVPVDRIPTPEVPDFRRDRLAAGAESPGASAPQPVGGQAQPITPAAWAARHRAAIVDAARILVDEPATATAAQRLEEAARGMEGDVPNTPAGREGAHALRLSLLVGAESLRAPLEAGQELRLISDRLWDLSLRLLSDGGVKKLPARTHS